MDGTLIDTEPMWVAAEQALLAEFGAVLPESAHAELVGSGLWDAAAYLQSIGVALSADEIVARLSAAVGEGIRAAPPAWRPGALELLASLREAGVPCALVTMSIRSLADLVVSLLPAPAFDVIVAGDEVSAEKPHPAPYLRGAELLGVAAADCVAIEDSPTGLRSAIAAGTVAVGVPNLVDLAGVGAHLIRPSLLGLDAAGVASLFTTLRGPAPSKGFSL